MSPRQVFLYLNEAGNGLLFAALILSVAFLFRFLCQSWTTSPDGTTFTDFRQFKVNKVAIGLATMFFGISLKSAATWWSLHTLNAGVQVSLPYFAVLIPVYVAGSALAVWGVVCTMRTLIPTDWRVGWLWSIGAAALLAVLLLL